MVLMSPVCPPRSFTYRLLLGVGLIAFGSQVPFPVVCKFGSAVQSILLSRSSLCSNATVTAATVTRHQEGGLRLDRRVAAFGEADSEEPVIVQRHSDQSLLIRRIIDAEAGELMPLDGQPLTQREVDLLRQWIDQGAAWPQQESGSSRQTAAERHWAYQPIQRPRNSSGDPAGKSDRLLRESKTQVTSR